MQVLSNSGVGGLFNFSLFYRRVKTSKFQKAAGTRLNSRTSSLSNPLTVSQNVSFSIAHEPCSTHGFPLRDTSAPLSSGPILLRISLKTTLKVLPSACLLSRANSLVLLRLFFHQWYPSYLSGRPFFYRRDGLPLLAHFRLVLDPGNYYLFFCFFASSLCNGISLQTVAAFVFLASSVIVHIRLRKQM